MLSTRRIGRMPIVFETCKQVAVAEPSLVACLLLLLRPTLGQIPAIDSSEREHRVQHEKATVINFISGTPCDMQTNRCLPPWSFRWQMFR